jgi:high-affinity K+ transport system ATPase subunit B
MVTTLAAEKVSAPLALFALVAGLGLSITVLVRTRTSRKSIAEDKTAFHVALAAMVVLCVVPSCAGAMLAAVVMSFPIRG